MQENLKKKIITTAIVMVVAVTGISVWQIFLPRSFGASQTVFYNAQSGKGQAQIATDLKNQGVISNSFFFQIYAIISGNASKLQAGLYDVSPSMSVAALVQKLASGDVAKNKITVLEGWTIDDMSDYLQNKHIYTSAEFRGALKVDYSSEFDFLKSKPKNVSLEGYLFPDTYLVPLGTTPEDFIRMMLSNFNKQLVPTLRKQITQNHQSIYQIVTMASILEKEVPTISDKKIVSGILWKRIKAGMPLQVDATVNYATGRSDASARLADTKIDSPYNTYKYYGLPQGPISSPGIDSLMAAIYPVKTAYWFYFSTSKTGKTIYSSTYQEHTSSIVKYGNT